MINGIVALTAQNQEVVRPIHWNIYSWLIDTYGLANTQTGVWTMFAACILSAIIAYLIGSINPAIIISRKVYHDDIRTHGSGNAGATNTLRTYGKKMAILIFALDLLKTAVAIVIGSLLVTREIGGAIAGLFVIVGHMFPIYYKFKGGKGVACLAIVALTLSPISFAILILLFIAIVATTGYVSLGSIMVVMLYPLMNNAFYPQNGMITFTGICIMALVVFMHRENIKRLLAGKESKLSFGKKKKNKTEDASSDDATEK
jgi:glycerol-3-phosphate acyltransferase PlsY